MQPIFRLWPRRLSQHPRVKSMWPSKRCLGQKSSGEEVRSHFPGSYALTGPYVQLRSKSRMSGGDTLQPLKGGRLLLKTTLCKPVWPGSVRQAPLPPSQLRSYLRSGTLSAPSRACSPFVPLARTSSRPLYARALRFQSRGCCGQFF